MPKRRVHDPVTGKVRWEDDGEPAGVSGSKDPEQSMQAAVGELRERPAEAPLKPKSEKTVHKLDDYSPGTGRYVRQQRMQLIIKHGHDTVIKIPISSYNLLEHRDQYDTRDNEHRKMLVESDETTLVLVATQHDPKHLVGRSFRRRGATPISTLSEALRKAGLLKELPPAGE